MRRRTGQRAWWRALANGLLFIASAAQAHDLISADAAQRYLAQARQQIAVINAGDNPSRRADAHLNLALLQDEVSGLLNRDIVMHGRVQGLQARQLIDGLQAVGAPLPWSQRQGLYATALAHYRAALELDAGGAQSRQVLFGLIHGTFQDSHGDDPLKPTAEEPATSLSLITWGERFLREHASDANLEEVRFIMAIAHVRLTRAGRQSAVHAPRARELLAEFKRLYPDSLRAAAVPVLLDALR